ncbi:MAG: thimet oligopeptidase [Candidatus Eremiobacteraeota bacterium]|nr:thimet oligopeptidase [Candidatus Eremiobacteraeota bacterium]
MRIVVSALLAVLFLAGPVATTAAAPPAAAAMVLPPSPAAALDLAPTPEKIGADCATAIASLKAKIDAITALPQSQRTFATVPLAYNEAAGAAYDAIAADLFMGDIGPAKPQRDAAAACSVALSKFTSEQGARPDLYAALADADRSGTATTPAQKKLLSDALIDAKRAGAALTPAQRTEYLALSARMTELRRSYSQNVNETRTPLRFTAAQLAGLSPDRLAAFTKDGDSYIVPATEANYAVVTAEATNETTRRTLYATRFNQMAAKNDPIFEEVVATRAKIAHLLGYPNWAAFVLDRRMAKTPQKVDAFLADLDAKLLPQARVEAEALRALKVKETGNPQARLEAWDTGYYTAVLKRTKYALDPNVVRSYYPVEKTVPAIFGVYAQLLGVTFAKRDDAKTWAPNVQAFAVSDTATGRYLGDIYLDLFPREGKNAHFHSATFWRHRTLADGTIRPALNAIVGEFPQPAPGQPALLTQADVETFFHEFGHSIAALVKTSPYGLDFTWDFVEAPSQMLENWVWDPAVLKRISSNVTTGAPMPDDLIAKMRATRLVDQSALSWTRQIALATADMTYHEHDTAPMPNQTWAEVYGRTTPIAFPADIHFEANFNHIVGSGYSAGYYGYLWSKVYAQDMFSRFSRDGLLNPATGAAYREILSNAGLDDADVQVARFVGHQLDPGPFYATLGITTGTKTSAR